MLEVTKTMTGFHVKLAAEHGMLDAEVAVEPDKEGVRLEFEFPGARITTVVSAESARLLGNALLRAVNQSEGEG